MDNHEIAERTEIATELRRRASELRAAKNWTDFAPDAPGQECAVMRIDNRHDPVRMLSRDAHRIADCWLLGHGYQADLTSYNDAVAVDQHDVANILEKIAEDITA